MQALTGTFRNGQIVFDGPVNLAEGTRVEVQPLNDAPSGWGMRDEDWPTTPEGLAALAARMLSREPVELTEEEDADWRRSLHEQRQRDKENFFKHAEELERMCE